MRSRRRRRDAGAAVEALAARPAGPHDELEALLQASRAALTRVDLDAALSTILDGAIRLVEANEGSIQLLDDQQTSLRIAASRGLPEEARGERVPVGQGISGTVVATGRPLLLPSAVDVDRFIGYIPKTRRIYGALCIPLIAGDGKLGVLNMTRTQPGPPFEDRDLRLAVLFAESAAQAIQNARLLARAERHNAELETLRAASLRLAGSLDLNTVAETALTDGLGLAGGTRGFLCLPAEDGTIELVTFLGLARDGMRRGLSTPEFASLMRQTEARLVPDASVDPALAGMAADFQGDTLAVLPLRTSPEGPGGVVVVGIPSGREGGVLRLLSTYALEVSLSVSNALLHRHIAEKQQELGAIVSSVDAPMILVGPDGTFRTINREAATTFGLVPDFETGQPVRGKLGERLETILLERDDDVATELSRTVSGERRLFRARAVTVRTGPRAGARLLVLVDITSQRDLEQRKADFLSVIGHELRTPLTSIRGYARTMERHGDALPPETRERAIGTILTQAQRLERLIEDLLLVSRIETQRPPLHLAWDDIGDVCRALVDEVRESTPERTLTVRVPSRPVPILTDRLKVEQILSHLLDNALKFSEGAAPIEVTLVEEEDSVAIAVRDRGIGIFSGDVPRLFRPFGQLDGSATRKHGGTGVGLSICKALLDLLGGSISVKTALGKGSTFTVTIPRRTQEPDGS